MTDLTALEGELAALRSFLAALLSVLPVSLQLRAIPAFEHNLELLQDRLCPSAQAASARAAASLVARQRQVKALGASAQQALGTGPSLGTCRPCASQCAAP